MCTVAEFDEYVARAAIAESWVSDCVPTLRRILQCNQWARQWYEKASNAKDGLTAWAAIASMTPVVDSRWQKWRDANAEAGNPHLSLALRVREGDIKQRLEIVARKRATTLFSIKREDKELCYTAYAKEM
jgi:hypothetical protein